MLLLLLHRGSSLRAVSGRIVDWIPSAGNRLFEKRFSSTTLCLAASAKQEWREVFEGIFEWSSLSTKKFIDKQPAGSAQFLLNAYKNPVYSKGAKQEALKGFLTEKVLQLSEDDKLLQVFRHLVQEQNVDHAIVLCHKLPANLLKTGIETLIRVCLERVYDATYQRQLADKIFQLLQQSKGKGCIPSEVTSQNLVKWLLDNGDAWRAQNFLQLLQNQQHSSVSKAFECPESMDLGELEHSEAKMSQKPMKQSDIAAGSSVPAIKYRTSSGKDLSSFLKESDESKITVNTRWTAKFRLLGRSGYQETFLDNFEFLKLKGMPEPDLSKLIDCYVQGLTEVSCGDSRKIKKGVEGFKKINSLFKLSTNTPFNMLISHCADHGEIACCMDLIQTMKSNGLQPCAASYEPLIAFFAGTFEISKAEDILRMMRNNGVHASKKAYECLIVGHTKSHNLEKAFNLIEEIPLEELTADIYTPIFHAYGKMGQVSMALSVFSQMRLKNVKPNAQNFASLIYACAMRKDLKGAEKVFKLFKKEQDFAEESHKLVMSAMLRVYAICGNDEQIEKMMSCTYANHLVKSEAESALLKGFADRGETQKAIEIYNQIRNGGTWPDSGAFLSLLFTLGTAGKLDQLLALFDPFKKSIQTRNRLLQEHLLCLACCLIVHALINHNHLERALDFFQKIQLENAGDVETLCLKVFMHEKWDATSVQPEPLTLKDKLEFLCAMRDRLKVQPTRLAYEALLESCAREKNVECADRVLCMMKSDRLVLNVFTYLRLLRIVVSLGNLRGLNLFLSKMRREVENIGLQDNHVKLVVNEILKNANVNTSDLMCILYPSTEIYI